MSSTCSTFPDAMAFNTSLFMNYRMLFLFQTGRTKHGLMPGVLHRIVNYLMRTSEISQQSGFTSNASISYHYQIFYMHMSVKSS